MARPGLRQHPKFKRLVHLLRERVPHVLGYLECLWHTAYEACNPVFRDAVDVELSAEWPGEPGTFCAALVECHLLDPLEDGSRFEIHDFFDHAPEYVQKRFRREVERRQNGQARRRAFAPRARPQTAGWREDARELGRHGPPISSGLPAPEVPSGAGEPSESAADAVQTTADVVRLNDHLGNLSPPKSANGCLSDAQTPGVGTESGGVSDLGGLNGHIGGLRQIKADIGAPPSPVRREEVPIGTSSATAKPSARKKAEKTPGEKESKPRAPRPNDQLWNALCALFGLKPVTEKERTRVGGLVRDLGLKEALPDELPVRLARYRAKYPNAAETPEALLKHWDQMAQPTPQETALRAAAEKNRQDSEQSQQRALDQERRKNLPKIRLEDFAHDAQQRQPKPAPVPPHAANGVCPPEIAACEQPPDPDENF